VNKTKKKISNFLQILGILNVLTPNLVKELSGLKIYNILVIPCGVWTLKQRDIRRLKIAEPKFMKRTTGYNTLRLQKKWINFKGT
jgi:hypothetical protein